MSAQVPLAVQVAVAVVLFPSTSTDPSLHVMFTVSSYSNVTPVGYNSALSTVKAAHCTSVRHNYNMNCYKPMCSAL